MPGATDIQMVTKYGFIIFDSCKHEHIPCSASGTNWKKMINSCCSSTTANLSTAVWGLAAACPETNVYFATGSRPRDAKVRRGQGIAADVCVDVEEIDDGEVSLVLAEVGEAIDFLASESIVLDLHFSI